MNKGARTRIPNTNTAPQREPPQKKEKKRGVDERERKKTDSKHTHIQNTRKASNFLVLKRCLTIQIVFWQYRKDCVPCLSVNFFNY